MKKKLGKDHPDLSYVYKQITLLYNDLNKYEDALKYCKKELRIRKKQLGQDHPDTAENNAIMANLLNKLEHPSKALFYCKKALNVMEKLRRKHPNIEVAYHFMSDILYNLGEYDQALDYLRKELEIIEKKLGKGHYTTARCYNAMGNILSHQGKDEEASATIHHGRGPFQRQPGLGRRRMVHRTGKAVLEQIQKRDPVGNRVP